MQVRGLNYYVIIWTGNDVEIMQWKAEEIIKLRGI